MCGIDFNFIVLNSCFIFQVCNSVSSHLTSYFYLVSILAYSYFIVFTIEAVRNKCIFNRFQTRRRFSNFYFMFVRILRLDELI